MQFINFAKSYTQWMSFPESGATYFQNLDCFFSDNPILTYCFNSSSDNLDLLHTAGPDASRHYHEESLTKQFMFRYGGLLVYIQFAIDSDICPLFSQACDKTNFPPVFILLRLLFVVCWLAWYVFHCFVCFVTSWCQVTHSWELLTPGLKVRGSLNTGVSDMLVGVGSSLIRPISWALHQRLSWSPFHDWKRIQRMRAVLEMIWKKIKVLLHC